MAESSFLTKNCHVPHVCRVLQLWHTANFEFCRVFLFLSCVHRARARHTGTFAVCVSFAVCQEARHTANMGFAVCLVLCRVLRFRYTAKATFAVCPIFGTRQSLRHTATSGFSVVAAPHHHSIKSLAHYKHRQVS